MIKCKYAHFKAGKDFLRCSQMKGQENDMCVFQYWCHQIHNYRNTSQVRQCKLALAAQEQERLKAKERE